MRTKPSDRECFLLSTHGWDRRDENNQKIKIAFLDFAERSQECIDFATICGFFICLFLCLNTLFLVKMKSFEGRF